MSDLINVTQYFTRSAEKFDSLYCQEEVKPIVQWVNHKFRRDIYERFRLSLKHIYEFKLQTALDVGCGSGRYVSALVELGLQRIVGLDVSAKMIDMTANRIQGLVQHGSVELVCSDFTTFRTTEKFDVVMAMGFFDYIKDPVPVLKQMRELAAHSVIASFPSISLYRTPIRKVRYYFKQCPVYFYRYDEIDQFSRTVEFIGRKVTKIEGAGQDYFVVFFNRPPQC